MVVNEENLALASSCLGRLRHLQGAPDSPDVIEAYTLEFCRLVHNKTFLEILQKERTPDEYVQDMIEKKKIDPNQNDIDWIMQKLIANCEKYPYPVVIQRAYTKHWPPAYGRKELRENHIIQDSIENND